MTHLSNKIAKIVSGDILSKSFAFVTTIYLTRTLGAEGYGLVTIALSYLGYSVYFADFGLYNIGNREVAKSPSKRAFTPTDILFARVLLATIIFCITWFILPFIIADPLLLQLTKGFSVALLAHAILIEWYFVGDQQYGINAYSRTVHTAIYAIGAILAVKSIADIDQLPKIYVLSFFVAAISIFILALRQKAFKWEISGLTVFRNLFKASSSVGSGLLFAQIVQLLPPIVIGVYISTADAGLFSAAYKVIIIGMLFDRLFVQLLIPNLSKYWSESEETATKNMEHTSRIMLVIGGAISLSIAIGATEISHLLYGEEFANSAIIIVSLSLFLFFTFQNSMFSHGLVAIGKDSKFFIATSVGGILAIISIVISAIYFDAAAVGLSVALGEFVIAGFCFYWFRQYLKFSYILEFFAALGFGISLYFASSFIHLHGLIEAVLGAIIFSGILYIGRVIKPSDIRWLKSILIK